MSGNLSYFISLLTLCSIQLTQFIFFNVGSPVPSVEKTFSKEFLLLFDVFVTSSKIALAPLRSYSFNNCVEESSVCVKIPSEIKIHLYVFKNNIKIHESEYVKELRLDHNDRIL